MKNKDHWEVLAFILGLTILISGCAGSPNSKCKSNNDCAIGYLCDGSGACLTGDHIKITTTEVSIAIINNNYSFQTTHEGGIDPLTWSIDTSASSDYLDWLAIDSATGMLINIQGPPEKLPSKNTNAATFTVSVTDSSDNGKGETTSQPYTMIIRVCNNDFDTFKPANGMCKEGTQRCNNGVLGDFEPANPSTNPNHCGVLNDQCSNCDNNSNGHACVEGICGCNSDSECNGLKCCDKKCVTLDTIQNCGYCGAQCVGGATCNKNIIYGYHYCSCTDNSDCPSKSNAVSCFSNLVCYCYLGPNQHCDDDNLCCDIGNNNYKCCADCNNCN